jgi:hypothetical protein
MRYNGSLLIENVGDVAVAAICIKPLGVRAAHSAATTEETAYATGTRQGLAEIQTPHIIIRGGTGDFSDYLISVADVLRCVRGGICRACPAAQVFALDHPALRVENKFGAEFYHG